MVRQGSCMVPTSGPLIRSTGELVSACTGFSCGGRAKRDLGAYERRTGALQFGARRLYVIL
ncbi:hypothetical protein CHLRE_07g319310v5 [Chlamydomonas reinhardtii]|uniref:Uncharacterized protein n=1 Tax=Chlamydomonas reinhardtii TaxID=3055 RepID=A0A2K3DIX3_CHLRE|nr:uncharacterized protein CHLRE_07g319310v5 [Chlamydomonas reinhardtii]PNW80483.1 hypothetical protein CHLRE_07g319310v5 [Chlamydomonas reinhardtii]